MESKNFLQFFAYILILLGLYEILILHYYEFFVIPAVSIFGMLFFLNNILPKILKKKSKGKFLHLDFDSFRNIIALASFFYAMTIQGATIKEGKLEYIKPYIFEYEYRGELYYLEGIPHLIMNIWMTYGLIIFVVNLAYHFLFAKKNP